MEKELTRVLQVYDSIEEGLAFLKTSLFSKNYTNECIESLRVVNLLGMLETKGAFELWKKAFGLIWVKEPLLKQELLKIFHKIYVDASEPEMVVSELIDLALKLDFHQKLSFEEILRQLLVQEKEFRYGEKTEKYTSSENQAAIDFRNNPGNRKKNQFRDEFM